MASSIDILIIVLLSLGFTSATDPDGKVNINPQQPVNLAGNGQNDGAVQLFTQLSALERDIESMNLEQAKAAVEQLMQIYEPLKHYSRLGSSIHEIGFMLIILRDMISGCIDKTCTPLDLADRATHMVDRFRLYPKLKRFIENMNHEHARFCMSNITAQFFNILHTKMMPSTETNDNMHQFLDFWFQAKSESEPNSSNYASTSRDDGKSIRRLKSDKRVLQTNWDDEFLKETLVRYMDMKYNLYPNLNDRDMFGYTVRLSMQLDKFMRIDDDAFCQPLLQSLAYETNILQNLLTLLHLDPEFGTRLDKDCFEWFSALIICNQIKNTLSYSIVDHYIKTRLKISHLENRLLDTNNQLSPRETYPLLSILRDRYNEPPGVEENINVHELLDAKFVHYEDKCDAKKLNSLAILHRDHQEYPNLDAYLKVQIERQVMRCLVKFEQDIKNTYRKVDIFKRKKITDFRHTFEKLLDREASPPETELWLLTSPRRSDLFNGGMADYIVNTIGCNSRDIQEIKRKLEPILRQACQEIQQNMVQLHAQGTQLVRLGGQLSHTAHSWLSSFALCDAYLRDSFSWEPIFNHLNGVVNDQRIFGATFGSLFGKCVKPE